MTDRMFGLETEYAFVALDRGGQPLPRAVVTPELIEIASEKLAHFRGCGQAGIFLGNGSRLYIDCGFHPEMSTPEVMNPWDAVRYQLAGDAIVVGIAAELEQRSARVDRAVFLKGNVDYSGTRSTWGGHESYLHRVSPEALPGELMPHLVTRMIHCGAGGFDNTSHGIDFLVSPRVPHLRREISGESTHSRGIFHTRNEPLCGKGYHRLHVLCGENLCSQTSQWLRVGTTALVVALVDAGRTPGKDVALAEPVRAMRQIARDVRCRTRVRLASGERATAIQIQRHYLEQVEACTGAAFMPAWAADVCRLWRETLDGLERGPDRLARTLDWRIKLELYREHARSRGLPWNQIPDWNRVVRQIVAALRSSAKVTGRPPAAAYLLSNPDTVRRELESQAEFLSERGLAPDGFASFLRARQELFELDVRYGEVGDHGLFSRLERSGALAHDVPGVDRIEEAREQPPAAGRAHTRGGVIRENQAEREHFSTDWSRIFDARRNQVLDLSDPFSTEREWRAPPGRPRPDPDDRTAFRQRLAQMRARLSQW